MRRTKPTEIRLSILAGGTSRERHQAFEAGARTVRADYRLISPDQLFKPGVAGGTPVSIDGHELSFVKGHSEVKSRPSRFDSRRAAASS
ncbi:MAG TPA: hypothetical protein VFH26_06260 [Gemmatimonadales bacterium]|nr:hypothetical protein [Gemmatimonadales bacterium]